MSHLYSFIAGALILLASLAAFSRIADMPQSPQYIKNLANGIGNLFNGAFGQ